MSLSLRFRRAAIAPVLALGVASLLGGCVDGEDYGYGPRYGQGYGQGYGHGYGGGYAQSREHGHAYAAPAYYAPRTHYASETRYANGNGHQYQSHHHHDHDR